MARKLLLGLAVTAFVLSLAVPGFSKGMSGDWMKGTVTKIEGNQVTVTVESKDKMDLKEGDHVVLKGGKMMMKEGGESKSKEGGMKSSPPAQK